MTRSQTHGAVVVATTLAVAIGTALNLFTLAAALEVLLSIGGDVDPIGLDENTTQILAAWGGGIIGIIGAVVGYQVGKSTVQNPAPDGDTPTSPPPPVVGH